MVMASTGVNMPGGDGNVVPAAVASSTSPFSSTAGCRMRSRRRRLAPPPVAATAAGFSEGASDAAGPSREKRVRPAASPASSSSPSDRDSDGEEAEDEADAEAEELQQPPLPPAVPQLPAAAAQAWPVAFGSLSVAGRSRDMEDTVSLRPGFHTWVDGSPMHFFGVFDGHGGSHVSELCRDRMHDFLAEELAAEESDLAQRLRHRQQQPEAAAGEGTSAGAGAGAWAVKQQEEEEERAWRAALERTFRRVDAMASLACACGRIVSPPCRCPLSGNSGIVGSTAVVALLVRGRLVVANCGDSRAVLCRGPDGAPPVQLSDDHKETGCYVLK